MTKKFYETIKADAEKLAKAELVAKALHSKLINTIVQKRKEKGFSQQDLADFTGVSLTTVARIERFKLANNLEKLSKILMALGYRLSIEEDKEEI